MLTVALTKADCVDEARVDEVERQVKEVLREYGFAEAKLFITAATEGRGMMPCASICFSYQNVNTPANIVSASQSTAHLP